MASSKAGFHQKDGSLVIWDQLASGDGVIMGAAEDNLGGLEIDATAVVTGDQLGSIFQARLTGSSSEAVMTSDNASITTLYVLPYKGDKIALYNTTDNVWELHTLSSASIAINSGSTSGRGYDIFIYDSGGTPTLERVVWTSGTVRATALAKQDGIYVKTGDASRRYVGSYYQASSTITQWRTDGGTSNYGALLIWNYYNRVPVIAKKQEVTNTWTYSTSSWRSMNNSSSNEVRVFRGIDEDSVHVHVELGNNWASGDAGTVGIGIDSSTATSADTAEENASTGGGRAHMQATLDTHAGQVGEGYHFFRALEYRRAGTVDFIGDNGYVGLASGITVRTRM